MKMTYSSKLQTVIRYWIAESKTLLALNYHLCFVAVNGIFFYHFTTIKLIKQQKREGLMSANNMKSRKTLVNNNRTKIKKRNDNDWYFKFKFWRARFTEKQKVRREKCERRKCYHRTYIFNIWLNKAISTVKGFDLAGNLIMNFVKHSTVNETSQ